MERVLSVNMCFRGYLVVSFQRAVFVAFVNLCFGALLYLLFVPIKDDDDEEARVKPILRWCSKFM